MAKAEWMTGRFPRRFGKYVLLKPLAKGGMGEVYMAAGGEIGGFEKLCVIKKVISEKADRSKANRFLDEAKVVLRLSHAALVNTFDAGEVEGEFYIAMELVEGKDLREMWNRCVRTRQRIPLDVALHVVREVARALAYVHAYGDLKLVHRDVAPPNILLAYVGDVKLTDFGLARSVLKQEHTAPGVVFGRAAYLAPEQARGEVADARTDVYTLGIVLWELLTGQQFLQIAGLDPAAALAIVRHPKLVAPSTRAPWLTPALDAVALKALAPDRNDRYASADELRRALSDVIATIAPRAGADRVSDFLHTIYADTIVEEREERERFLGEEIARFRDTYHRGGARSSHVGRARRSVVSPPSLPREARAKSPSLVPASLQEPSPPTEPVAAGAGGAVAAARVKVAHRRATPAPVRRASPVAGNEPRLPGLPPSVADASPAALAPRDRTGSVPIVIGAGAAAAVADTGGEAAVDNVAPLGNFVGRLLGGKYRVLRQIGEGGMGRVYAAEHIEIGKPVAIKVLHPACSTRSDLVERFRREARAASRIGHPNIVDVTDFGTTDEGLVYYVMEHLAGVDLADVLAQEGRIEPTRAMQIAVQICQALQAAHSADIVHRDLKPENIFLQPGGAQGDLVKILDFGLARSLETAAVVTDGRRLTNPGMPIGTPEYMAPEQAQGRPADGRADIYALGAILYEMVTGTPAFTGSGYAEILARKTSSDPQPPRAFRPDVPAELERVTLAMLERDPADRPQTMTEVEYELTKTLRGRGGAVAALLGLESSATIVVTGGGAEPDTGPDRRLLREAAFRAIGSLEEEAQRVPHPVSPAPPPRPSPGPAPADPVAVAPPSSPRPVALSATPLPPPLIGQSILARYGLDPSGVPRRAPAGWMYIAAGAAIVAAAVTLLSVVSTSRHVDASRSAAPAASPAPAAAATSSR